MSGYVLSCEMTVTRQQPDGTDQVEVITVEQEFDAAGQPVGECPEGLQSVMDQMLPMVREQLGVGQDG